MDTVSTLSTITSSTATAPSSASQQLTYTTAGTLYNPSSSQPLQPPTRRGRSLKWAAGGPHGNLALLPKSFLATLPLKAGTCRTTAVHQYTPLQQNYDRASTPFNDPDHFSANMSAQVPRLRAGDTTFTSFFSELERDKYTDGDASEESDDESDLGMDPLMNMTALQPNVASRNGGNDDDDDDENMSALTQHTLVQAGIDDLEFVSDSASSVYRAAGSSSPEARPMAVLKKMISSTDDVFAGTNDQHAMMASWNQEHRYHKGMFLPTWTWPSESFHTNWTPLSARMAGPWKPGTDRLTDDVIAARNEKINRDWHAGADFLGKTMEDVVDEARHRGAGKTFGAIGDGRPLKTKDKYGPIDVTEANRMSVAEHAKPLLNMAFASVLRHVEVDSCKSGLLQTEKRAETSGEQAGGRASGQAVGQGNWGSQSLFGKKVDGEQ
ncbi:uncharacterized protein AUP68_06838 [Ilyonectria robusta]